MRGIRNYYDMEAKNDNISEKKRKQEYMRERLAWRTFGTEISSCCILTADKVTPYRGGAARGGYGYGVACPGGWIGTRMRCGPYHWTRRVAPSRAAFPIR